MMSEKIRGSENWHPEWQVEFLKRLVDQQRSLDSLCTDTDMPSSSYVYEYLKKNEDFKEDYARARILRDENAEIELLEVADNARNDWMQLNDPDNEGYKLNGEHIQRSRLRVDTRKWVLARRNPKKWGDKIHVDAETTTRIEVQGMAEDEKLELMRSRLPSIRSMLAQLGFSVIETDELHRLKAASDV